MEENRKFQIVEVSGENYHAGAKAPRDISEIAENLDFTKVFIRMRTGRKGFIGKLYRQVGYVKDWITCYKSISINSIVLVQNPFHHRQIIRELILKNLRRKKHIRYISFIHDVEELREIRFNRYYQKEFQIMLQLADIFIVHNNSMKVFFQECGVQKEKLISLEIFDYLVTHQNSNEPIFSKSINIAGNLDVSKCKYLGRLNELHGFNIDLYGPNFDERIFGENVIYHGVYPPNELNMILTRGFGLVWDGDSIDDCTGSTGRYLKYNNPHKLSLYLSCGIPVIIWDKAASATFVKRYNLGFCIERLNEIQNLFKDLTYEQYRDMCRNVEIVGKKIRAGFFTEKAIQASLEALYP